MADEETEVFIVYPTTDYNSWITLEYAEIYFIRRLNSGTWEELYSEDQEKALVTAFRALSELDVDLSDLESPSIPMRIELLTALQQAQCEQAQHELSRDLDGQQATSVSIGGLLSARFAEQKATDRFSERALAFLRPWISRRSVKRFR